MVTCYPSTPKNVAVQLACCLFGTSLFVIGAHYSYANVARQQALIKARNDFVRERLRKRSGQ